MFVRTGIGAPVYRPVPADLTVRRREATDIAGGHDVVFQRKKARLCLIYAFRRSVHGGFMSVSRILLPMGDFMAVLGIIAFALVMLGLIWGLEHV